MFARTVILSASVAAVVTASVAAIPARQGPQEIVLTGEPGDPGPAGPSGVMQGTGWISLQNGVASLAVPMSCANGSVLKQVAGAFVCAPDDAGSITGVATLNAGPGTSVSSTTGNVTLAVRFGLQSDDVATGNHSHEGDNFAGSRSGPGLSVVNTLLNDSGTINPVQYGIRAQLFGEGTDFSVVPAFYHAAIVAKNTAAGGVAIAGLSTDDQFGPASGTRRVGVAGYAGDPTRSKATGSVFGVGHAGAEGVHAYTDQVSSVALYASNTGATGAINPTGPEIAINTVGTADFGGSSLNGLVNVYESFPGAGGAYLTCASAEEIAISSQCFGTEGVVIRCLVNQNNNLCLSNGQNAIQNPNGMYCAAAGGGIITQMQVVCLRTSMPP